MDEATRRICDFLWFGFCPSISWASARYQALTDVIEDESIAIFDQGSLKTAKLLLVEIVEDHLQGAKEVVVPLSAGYDSRALLGAALEILPASQIKTYTLGHEGSEDFDRAKALISGSVTHHFHADVLAPDESSWSTEKLIARVRERPAPLFFSIGEMGNINARLSNALPMDAPRLVGFLGDSLSGKKLPAELSGRWSDAIHGFVRRNKAYKGAFSLTPAEFEPKDALPRLPFNDTPFITMDDQLDWCFRQEQRIRLYLNAHGLGQGRSLHPFDDYRWWRSWMLIDSKHRKDQRFYRRLLRRHFGRIFPDLDESGEQLVKQEHVGPKPMHVDMDLMLETVPSFRRFCVDNVFDLAKRDVVPWINADELIRQAKENPKGMGRGLYALASLEINFKAGRSPSDVDQLNFTEFQPHYHRQGKNTSQALATWQPQGQSVVPKKWKKIVKSIAKTYRI